MNSEEFAQWEQRISERAQHLWEDAGRPEGPRDTYLQNARELIAIEENPTSGTLEPDEAAEPVVEEAALIANLGEFTSYSERQGEEPLFPTAEDDSEESADMPAD